MGQALDQAERERELTKRSLQENLGRLEARVRSELDWKARLRRDGVRVAVITGAVVAAGATVLVVRHLLRGTPAPERPASSFDELAAEVAAIRKRLDRAKVEPDQGPAWQKIGLRAVSAAAAAGGTYAARQALSRARAAGGTATAA